MATDAGRVVLVTSASRGIGRATAAALAAEGARVAVNHPGEPGEAAETAALVEEAGGKALVVEADVANPKAVDALASRVDDVFGPVDVLVNNAGICPHVEFFDIDVDLWDRVHNVN